MNPLSPFTYYRHHKWSALLLLSLITLTTLGLFVMIAFLDSMTLMNAEISYLKQVSLVIPNGEPTFEPGVISRIQNNPDVGRVIPENGISIRQPGLVNPVHVPLLGIPQDELEYLISQFGLRIKEGRLLEPRTNEIMLTEEVVRALGLKLGDQIAEAVDPQAYRQIQAPMVLVGILEGMPDRGKTPNPRVGLASYEYFDSHELHENQIVSMLVTAQPGRRQAVSEFLETDIQSARAETDTYERQHQFYNQDRQGVLLAFGIINMIVAIGAAIVMGIVNQIAITQRLPELGLLNALGYHKKRLIRRLTLETATVTDLSWAFGLVLAFAVLVWLKTGVYYHSGMELDLSNLTPLWFVIPIPLTVIALSTIGIVRAFSRFDAVAIVERGKLALESGNYRHSLSRFGVLAAFNYYLRHRRRGITLLLSTVLAILVIALPIFIATATTDAMKPDLAYLHSVSEVYSEEERTVDPGVIAQIKSHPRVDRVIPAMSLALQVAIPMGNRVTTEVHGVLENDLPYLLDTFGMQVINGRLPESRSNEIVVAKAVAQNLGLRIGDVIDLPHYIVYGAEQAILFEEPVEMVVVGILERQAETQNGQSNTNEMWLSFASYEFMSSHEILSSRLVRLFIVPSEGHKAELDQWLDESIASKQTHVSTYASRYTEITEMLRNLTLSFTIVEIGIALIAAISITVMNHILFTQRKDEFGILNALGRNRFWLILRTAKETGSIVAVAWLISIAIYGVCLAILQAAVFAPKGIHLDLFNPIPWLFTFPIPLTVILSSAGAIAWILHKLDPVRVIERR